ncbi:MAG: acyltransferase family protein [Methyloglobulus sp.]
MQAAVLPYVIFLSAYLICLVLIQKIGIPTTNAPPRSIPDFIQIILLHPRGAYWFLHSLILIQLCFMFAKALTSRTKWDDTVFFSLSFSLLALVCHYHLCSQRVALYFLLGVILRRFGNVLPASLKSGSLLIVIILIFTGEEIFKLSFIQFAWCLAMLAFLAGLGQAMESSPVVSLFAWLGRNSLIVLVVHAMFVVSLKPSATLFLKLDQTGLLYSTAVVVITMSGCVLSAFLFDRTRISQYLFGVDKIYSDLKLSALKKPA